MKNTLIAPSVLAADFANLQRDIEMINNSQADWFHIDIMDGVFVPKKQNSGNQPEFQSSIKKRTVNQTVVIVHFQKACQLKKLGVKLSQICF